MNILAWLFLLFIIFGKLLQFLWTPYLQPMVNRLITINVSPIIRAFVPLICFANVKFDQVDRVVKQFGW